MICQHKWCFLSLRYVSGAIWTCQATSSRKRTKLTRQKAIRETKRRRRFGTQIVVLDPGLGKSDIHVGNTHSPLNTTKHHYTVYLSGLQAQKIPQSRESAAKAWNRPRRRFQPEEDPFEMPLGNKDSWWAEGIGIDYLRVNMPKRCGTSTFL